MRSTATFVGCALVLAIAVLLRSQATPVNLVAWLRPTLPELLAWSPLAGFMAAAVLQWITRSTWVGIVGILVLVPAAIWSATTWIGMPPAVPTWYALGAGWLVLYVSAMIREIPVKARGWKPPPETIPGLPSILVTLVIVYMIVFVDLMSRTWFGEGYSLQSILDGLSGSVRAMRWQG